MNIDNNVLKDILNSTTLSEKEITTQFNDITTVFKRSMKPYTSIISINEVHTFLLNNYPTYLKSIYDVLKPSDQRPADLTSDFDALHISNLFSTNQVIYASLNTNNNSSTKNSSTNNSISTDISKDNTVSISDATSLDTSTTDLSSSSDSSSSVVDLTPSHTYSSITNTTTDSSTSISSSSDSSSSSSSSYSSSSDSSSSFSSSSSFDSSSF